MTQNRRWSDAPSPVAKGTVWTGSDDGRIHVTRDGGATWTSVETSLPGAPKNATSRPAVPV
ncbi:MAG: hypothetical protein IPF66_15090 [Holophagales bacterium]|nr:hypothetical protein [Holophagales bacterium]